MVIKIPVPPNTPRNAPIEVSVDVGARILTNREVLFPRNASMLVGIQLREGGANGGLLWPEPRSYTEWITGDDCTVASTVPMAMRAGGPWRITARLYNDDSTFERTPEIRFEVEDITLAQLLQQLNDNLVAALEALRK